MKMGMTVFSETLAFELQAPVNRPEESIQQIAANCINPPHFLDNETQAEFYHIPSKSDTES
jgi:hypothetical protein